MVNKIDFWVTFQLNVQVLSFMLGTKKLQRPLISSAEYQK